MDAIRRCAIDKAQPGLGGSPGKHLQRPVQRQRIGGAAGILLGRDDLDLAQALHRGHQRCQAWRQVTIVVRYQDSHVAGIVGTPRLAAGSPGHHHMIEHRMRRGVIARMRV